MKTEIEVKFVGVDHDAIRANLKALGAKCEKPLRLMKRAIIETSNLRAKNAFVRIRDEGDKTTITYKQFDALSIDGAKEIEIIASDFDDAVALFAAAGLVHDSLQESKRETWRLNDVEIMLDTWPWLAPYIEVEGATEAAVKTVSAQLGLNWNDAVFGDVMAAYRVQYPHLGPGETVGHLSEVRFDSPLPDMFKR